ncbi:hypothetical protein LDO32_12690 [Luteimonas sp. Y-2-2-4F]|nr:hypothetical protein [Luteimonas sp. Y-2-2-4F]MCD9032583.1 hypothetical protein [Luteimonas sp. Y-2-2-4F]
MATRGDKAQDDRKPQDDDATRDRPRDPKAGLDREVGDLDDPDATQDDGALPGRAGGGLAGG